MRVSKNKTFDKMSKIAYVCALMKQLLLLPQQWHFILMSFLLV